MPARSVCLVTLSLSEAGPGRFGRHVSVTDIYHTIPYHHRHLHVPYHLYHNLSLVVPVSVCSTYAIPYVASTYAHAQ